VERRKIIRVGLDFDGVMAYNPLRILRAPVKLFKKEILGVTKLKFLIPHNFWQRALMRFYYAGSVWPSTGLELLKEKSKLKRYEFHIITGRFGSIDNNLCRWLKENGLEKLIKNLYVNKNDEQPHIFKQRTIEDLKLDYYIEDNLDVVDYLDKKSSTSTIWIYNLIDKAFITRNGFPNLKQALEWIEGQIT
jgi:hypothetical protein